MVRWQNRLATQFLLRSNTSFGETSPQTNREGLLYPSSLPHPPEWTKGGEHNSIVPANGIVATKILHTAAASIRYTLRTKHNNGSQALDRTIGGNHSVHGNWIKMVDTEHESTTRGLWCSHRSGWKGVADGGPASPARG
jgi:hypothetical protein